MSKHNKKRPQYIWDMIKDVNDNLRSRKLKWDEHYEDPLFNWCTQYLLSKKMYEGFNVHYDKEVTYSNGETKIIRALAGPDYETKDYYIQIW